MTISDTIGSKKGMTILDTNGKSDCNGDRQFTHLKIFDSNINENRNEHLCYQWKIKLQ